MTDTQVTWNGYTIGGGGAYHVEEITGWDDLPDFTSYDTPRARGHGDHPGSQFIRSRIVTVSGSIANRASRDILAQVLLAASPVETDAVEDLTIETFGQSLTAGARLIRRSLPVGENYAAGAVPFALQWKCPDPLRYGAIQTPQSTVLPVSSGGMAFPMAFPMDFGSSGTLGQITLYNAGTAPAPVQLTVTGSLPSGFEVSTTDGQRLRYEFPVASGETLTLDTGEGTLTTDGGADRRPYLTWADWVQVPASSSTTLQFSSLGGSYDPAAALTVPSFRSAWW
jgi:hypothetical protein